MLYTPLYVRYLTFSSTLRHLSIFFMFSNILSVTNVVSSPKASIHEHTERFTTNQQPTLLYWICNILMLNPFQIQIISLYWTKPKKASDNVFSYIIKTPIHSCVYIKHNSTNLQYKFEKNHHLNVNETWKWTKCACMNTNLIKSLHWLEDGAAAWLTCVHNVVQCSQCPQLFLEPFSCSTGGQA